MQNKLFGGIKIFKAKVFKDNRGLFREVYKKKFIKNKSFIFDCLSISKKNVLRGLQIFDVAIDLRKKSKTFGKYFSINLSSKNYCSIYIPQGFAHGFCCLDEENIVYYCNSNYRDKKNEIGIVWNDPDINIKWPIKNPILSKKDKKNLLLKEYYNNF
jgi:dTDP-4-dehydrorhamnose 3,5-epimerase